MSSPPAGSPPPSFSNSAPKRRASLGPVGGAQKKPKTARKASLVSLPTPRTGNHPLRQTSFPPEDAPDRTERSPSVDSIAGVGFGLQLPGGGSATAGSGGDSATPSAVASSARDQAGDTTQNNNEEEDDEDRGDDYGTTSLLAGGGTGGFQEADEDKQKLAFLLDHFDEDQMSRYEAFKRSLINKPAVKKIANQVLNQSITANVATVIAGFTKVYASQILERAMEIKNQWGDAGPLLPDHLREAQRRYRTENSGAQGFRGQGGTNNGPGSGAGDVFGAGIGRPFR